MRSAPLSRLFGVGFAGVEEGGPYAAVSLPSLSDLTGDRALFVIFLVSLFVSLLCTIAYLGEHTERGARFFDWIQDRFFGGPVE